MEWFKTTDLNSEGTFARELWIRKTGNKVNKYPMDIYLGKKTDLLRLKKNLIQDIKKQLQYYSKTRKSLYSRSNKEMEYVSHCPITGIPTEKARTVAKIYGAEYVQTPDTGHVYVKYRPTKKQIHNFYLNSVNYAITYTNKASAQKRLNSIAVPWVKWVLKVYEKQYQVKPKKILDVGSGGGHFVEACRRANIHADGIELSAPSRRFARDIWGLELNEGDFNQIYKNYRGYDIVTFWGLLEHTPNPKEFLKSAYKVVSKSPAGGMIISKLPRWISLSSASQRLNPKTIIRHIDPMGHIMLYTDKSAAESYFLSKFIPIAAWYYGMDIYETLMQIGNATNDYNSFLKSGKIQIELQQFVDENRFSDGIVLAGTPR